MFDFFKPRGRVRKTHSDADEMHLVGPDGPAVAPQSLIHDALREIDRHLASNEPTRDALLDVRLKLSPAAPSPRDKSHDWSERGLYSLLGALLLLDIYDDLEDCYNDEDIPPS